MKFKTGDIVVLISGGPNMTISRGEQIENITDYDGNEKIIGKGLVKCMWFEGGKLCGSSFNEESLKLADKESKVVE